MLTQLLTMTTTHESRSLVRNVDEGVAGQGGEGVDDDDDEVLARIARQQFYRCSGQIMAANLMHQKKIMKSKKFGFY